MDIILLESVRKLGIAGTKVKVKDGYGRNYLIPQNKAVRATRENVVLFEERKAITDSNNAQKLQEARAVAENIDNLVVTIVRQAADDGRLFGSVTAKDIIAVINEKGFTDIERSQIILSKPIKTIDNHDVLVSLHPEVNVTVKVNVIRSDDASLNK